MLECHLPSEVSGAFTTEDQELDSKELFKLVFFNTLQTKHNLYYIFLSPLALPCEQREYRRVVLHQHEQFPPTVLIGLSFMIHEIHEAPRKICVHKKFSADLEAVYQLYSSCWVYIDTGIKDGLNKKDCKRVIISLD